MHPRLEDILKELISGDDALAESELTQIAAQTESSLPEVLGALRGLLSDADDDVRWWAARALAELDHPSVPPLLIEILADPAAAVRQCAALGLWLRPHPDAVPDLITALDNQDRLFAGLAADALEQIGAAAVLPLLDVLAHGSQQARREAVRALAKIGDQRAIPALFGALDDDSAIIEHWANQGLERMGVGMIFFEP